MIFQTTALVRGTAASVGENFPLRTTEMPVTAAQKGRLPTGGAAGMLTAVALPLGTVAILIKQELLLVIVGGVFVLEAASVILQVGSFKTRGKRIFRMAPLHHHFELSGWSEPKVITRFLIIAIVCALFSLTTLKLR